MMDIFMDELSSLQKNDENMIKCSVILIKVHVM